MWACKCVCFSLKYKRTSGGKEGAGGVGGGGGVCGGGGGAQRVRAQGS